MSKVRHSTTLLFSLSLFLTSGVLRAAANPTLTLSQLLGGSTGGTTATAVAVDSAGNIYVTGSTYAFDFPVLNALQKTCNSKFTDACTTQIFIAKFNSSGTLVYSTYLGGTGGQQANAIAVDSTGAVYITGDTYSTDFPVVNAAQSTNPICPPSCGYPGTILSTSFVAKLNPAGSALVYSTYLGGLTSIPYNDAGLGIAVDAAGNAYVVGKTGASNFPLVNPIDSTLSGGQDGYVVKLSPSGSLLFSTYLGGSAIDQANAIALDSLGNMYVAGATYSGDFPALNAAQGQHSSVQDAFITKISAAGRIVYSTYLGGFGNEAANGIAVDSTGAAYVTGVTTSAPTGLPGGQGSFPLVRAFQTKFGGTSDAFVTKLDPTGATFVYSTYLGGGDADSGEAISVDASGNAYVAGTTSSVNFPVANALQSVRGGPAQTSASSPSLSNAFLSAFSTDGTQLIYSTYLGGSGQVMALAIALDSAGQAYIAGSAGAANFPTLGPMPTQGTQGSGGNAFVARITNSATAPPCVYTLSTTSVAFTGHGGSSDVLVTANSNACPWQAVSSASWLTITAGASASGIGDVLFSVPANPGLTAQTATITVAGQTISVLQRAPDQIATSSSSGVPGSVARVPVTMIVDPLVFGGVLYSGEIYGDVLNGTIYSITFNLSVIASGSAPAVTTPLAFQQDPALPMPQVTTGSGTITVTWPPSLRPAPVPGTIKLGELLVTIPAGATLGQSYLVRSGGGNLIGEQNEALVAGPDTTLWVGDPVPVTTWLEPSSAAPGGSALTITVNGQGFAPSSTVLWNGGARATTFVSETQLQASLTAADLVTAGTAQVSVSNPAPNGGQSAALPFLITAAAPPVLNVGGVVDSADYKITLSGDSIASVFGTNLAPSTASATGLPLPTTLAGVSVLVDGVPAPLFYVSPTQINLQMPWRLLNQTQTVVAVSFKGLTSNAITVPLSVRPVIYTTNSQGTGQGAIQDGVTGVFMAPAGSIPGSTSKPAVAGEIVAIYCTGLGPVQAESSTSDGNSIFEEAIDGSSTVTPQVTIGGVAATVKYAGLAPSFVGLYQVNVTVPAGVSGSALPVIMSIGTAVSNTVTMAVQ